jgi:predicted dienelactone hydrolase
MDVRGDSDRVVRRISIALLFLCLTSGARAFPVGERHLAAINPTAALRDAAHSDRVRVTVWYPAVAGAVERPVEIGTPGHPLFKPWASAQDSPFVDNKHRPVILFSHGYGSTARVMGWFTTALARAGYVVVAVDHPGNNGHDRMTVAGTVLFWERPGDLAAALTTVEHDPQIAPHLDPARLGVAGFSAGGFTALAATGGRVSLDHFRAFCTSHPGDGVCKPQKEFGVSRAQFRAFLQTPAMAAEKARANRDLSIAGVKAAFVMAPAVVQSIDPASLKRIAIPVSIILGDADQVAPPPTNGEVAAALIPGAKIKILHGVGHYDFLPECTPEGDATFYFCRTAVPRAGTHQQAIAEALALFDRTLASR